jgi:hypothetical protein
MDSLPPPYLAALAFFFSLFTLWVLLAIIGAPGILFVLAVPLAIGAGWLMWKAAASVNRRAGVDSYGRPVERDDP